MDLIAAIIIGYILGRLSNTTNEQITESIPNIQKIVARNIKIKKRVGAVERLDQKDLFLKENPKIKEEQEIMSDVFNGLGVKSDASN